MIRLESIKQEIKDENIDSYVKENIKLKGSLGMNFSILNKELLGNLSFNLISIVCLNKLKTGKIF